MLHVFVVHKKSNKSSLKKRSVNVSSVKNGKEACIIQTTPPFKPSHS